MDFGWERVKGDRTTLMHYRYQWRDKVYDISIERHGDGYRALVDGNPYHLEIIDMQPGILSLRIQGQGITLYWANNGSQKWISRSGCTYLLEKPSPRSMRRPGERAVEEIVRAPMPAQVRGIQVSEGDQVEKGQSILLLEAMKMEIRIQAPRKGRIARLLVVEGQPVERDQVLVEIVDM